MRLRFVTAALALLIALAASCLTTAAAEPAFRVRVSPVANLVYQLDCLSGYRRCTRPAFSELWDRLDRDDADARHLGRWRELQERYRIYADFAGQAPASPYPYTFPYLQARGIDVAEKLRLASLRAADTQEYAARLQLLMQPRDAREAAAIVRHFEPRFRDWWKKDAEFDLQRLAAGYHGIAERVDLGPLLQAIAVFFEVEGETVADLEVDLIALPEGAEASQATVVENHAIVESRRGEAPVDRLGVILHEFVHYLYSLAPQARHAAVLEDFIDSERDFSLRAYNLINEAIASTIGNGILERRLQTETAYRGYEALPDSFYADFYVDTLAKALVPVVADYLEAGKSLDRAFVATYLDTAAASLGNRRDDLALQLVSSAVVATDTRLAELTELPTRALTTFSLFTHVTEAPALDGTALSRYPELSGIVLVLEEDLPALAGFADPPVLEVLHTLAERTGSFVYGQARSPRATVYFVCGRDVAATGRALAHLLSRSTSFTGPSLPSGASALSRLR